MFKETDDIVRLGKLVYYQIPPGEHCRGCPILFKEGPNRHVNTHWHCRLRSGFSLIYDGDGPIKDDLCPKKGGIT